MIFLIHWNLEEAPERVARLRAAGYAARHMPINGPGAARAIRDAQPQAVVIDLDRLPSHGRETGLHLRQQKTTRHVPLIFVGGEREKVQRIRKLLPDATYATWPRIKAAIQSALKSTSKKLVVPQGGMAGYSGTPLPRKLGIKENHVVALIDGPDGFDKTLGECPAGAKLVKHNARPRNLTLCFVRSQSQLSRRLPDALLAANHGPVWFAWPKKASGVASDLNEQLIRDTGLANGLVDYKICAIDGTWSGLLFCRRKK